MRHVVKSSYLLAGAVFGSAALGLVLAVAMPFFLGRTEYARFSLALSMVQLISSVGFEWLRVSVVRHAAAPGSEGDATRQTLFTLYGIIVPAFLAVAAVIALAAPWSSAFGMAAAVIAAAAIQGAFDGRSALARAQFDNVKLAIAMVARPALTLVIVISLTLVTRSATGAITAVALSYIVAFAVFKDTRLPTGGLQFERNRIVSLTRFGAVAALGTNIALAVPAMLRSVIVGTFGTAGAGGTLLALDIGQRVFATIGMALNLLHLQSLIRTIDTASQVQAVARARYSITLEVALYAWLVAVLAATAGPVGRIIAPQSFADDFIGHLPMMALLMAGLCLRQYAVEPLFIVFRRVSLLALGPTVTLTLFGMVFAALSKGFLRHADMLGWLIGASAAGFLVPLVLLHHFYRGSVPLGAMLGFGCTAMAAAMLTPLFPGWAPWAALIAQGMVATVIYVLLSGLLMVFARLSGRRTSPIADAQRQGE